MDILGELNQKKILILGFAREGVSTLRFFRKSFPKKVIGVADKLPMTELSSEAQACLTQEQRFVKTYFGPAYLSALAQYDVVFKASGIRPNLPELAQALKRGVRLLSNVSLFFDLCPGTIIGVTGTKGKSTTSALIAAVLSRRITDVRLAGNIGIPPLESLHGATKNTLFVLELSSFYLAGLHKSPHIAVIQDIVPEHADYHGNFDAYVEAKSRIVQFQTARDFVIFNADFPLPTKIVSASNAQKISFSLSSPQADCFLENDAFVWNRDNRKKKILSRRDIQLRGKFNSYNVMPAIILGKHFGVENKNIVRAVSDFQSLNHRLNFVANIRGVEFYDDSLSTVPETAMAALEAFAGRGIILLAGGFDRGQDYSQLAQKILALHVKALVLFPTTGERLWQAVQHTSRQNHIPLPKHAFAWSMHDAVSASISFAQSEDVVLLSPAAPSFNMFHDYADRGMQFQEAVHASEFS